MTLPDFLLEASRVLIGLGLSVFIGGTLAAALARRVSPSREDGAPLFFEGNMDGALAQAKFVAAGALLVGVLLEVQVLGSSLSFRHLARAIVLFLVVASHVYAVMVVAPKRRYYAEKEDSFEGKEAGGAGNPWRIKAAHEEGKSSIVSLVGLLLSVAGLVLG